MSLHESLAALLNDMGFAQLSLAFVVVVAYLVALSGAWSWTLRGGAASTAFVAATGFAAVTPSWASGVVFLGLVVVSVAAFAAAAWLVSMMLGLGAERGPMPRLEDFVTLPAGLTTGGRSLTTASAIRSL